MRNPLATLGLLTLSCSAILTASAGPFTTTVPVQASGLVSPFAGCTADAGQPGTNYPNTEVEPWLDVNPTNPANLVAVWQQDRWSNGGSRGLVAGVSMNGGASWTQVPIPGISACSGHPIYLRASDPWVSFAPNGDLYHISDTRSFPVAGGFFPGDYLGLASVGDAFGSLFIKPGAGPNTADAFYATISP